ncbi:MAG: lactonase family protein [Gloeobacteraceae cyanobacterium ES-bin-144]|nr:lactonase family protein [Verrucomicrobiales bacterium]
MHLFFKTTTCLLGFYATLAASPIYIGTNTGGTSTSKGIYVSDFDAQTGKLTEPQLAAEYSNPGFLTQHPTKPVLLAVGAPKVPLADGSSTVAAFEIGSDHVLTFLGEASTGGKGACHLAVDSTGRTVAVANYGSGHISTVRLNDKGIPGNLISNEFNEGSGPNKTRQNSSHAHGVYFDKSNTHLMVPDLGLDKVFVYPFDATTSNLGAALPPLAASPGAGPRHMALSPDEKFAYVLNELDATILTASFDGGSFKTLGIISTLPADYSGVKSTAEIEVSSDGRFVYSSNRNHDTIAVFRRDPVSGLPTFVQHAACGGVKPRHFKIAPDGKWLLCAHQDSGTLSVLPRNPDTGELGAPVSTVAVPSPICILFPR